MTCRICLDEDYLENLIEPCNCTGSTAYVHEECLLKWLRVSNRTDCEICKFQYETFEVEESKITWCPKIDFGDTANIYLSVVGVGVFCHFMIPFYSSYFGTSIEDMFIYGNICQGLLILSFHPYINAREALFFWKMCSLTSITLASFLENDWNFVWIEAMITAVVGIHMYVHLLLKSKQVVRYININDRSTNGEVETMP